MTKSFIIFRCSPLEFWTFSCSLLELNMLATLKVQSKRSAYQLIPLQRQTNPYTIKIMEFRNSDNNFSNSPKRTPFTPKRTGKKVYELPYKDSKYRSIIL